MAHNHGNKAPGRKRTDDKKARNKRIQLKKKTKRASKHERQRVKLLKDEKHQEKKTKRLETLKAKSGYEANIKRGIKEKEECKVRKVYLRKLKSEMKRQRR